MKTRTDPDVFSSSNCRRREVGCAYESIAAYTAQKSLLALETKTESYHKHTSKRFYIS